ncbi:transcription termination/antitermination factor NusG [Leptospira inadai serovar Lyme str. 10]|uniref:Transcription termination/antitermination factor NusG n=2 Tax=Leptospira inadai serovar Lyme TaxID=293084 RepID=V6HH67_9LEPT|nr:UpxY family transcription antiterminator [Leptospira inadai]EQA35520.1 transcription termination/antitermination factor NusG [Leptospira inadai serovar Lyme str. 10]PNV75334.1 transcription antiterminator [Leptospira inadai serovar Lyme]
MTDPNKSWYAIYTFSRSEKKLANELEKKGIESFLPLIPVKKVWSDRVKTIYQPVFASYVFVKIDLNTEKIRVLQTPGAHHLLSVAGVPLPVPEEDINLVRIFVNQFPERLQIRNEEKMEPGNKVLITGGPFKGYRAIVLRKINSVTVKVAIAGIQSSVAIDIDPESIEIEEENKIGRNARQS